MQNPCQDSYYTLFSSYTMLLDYHEEQAKNSRWIRCKVADLQVEPLGESSPLIGNLSAFAAGTSQEAVKDTAENLGLAMRVNGELYPVRMTAYKSLLDRAKIGGTALPKLSREVLAEVLNECLKLYSADALLLIRDEKISAVHSGDEVDYSVLPIDELLKVLQAKLDARFSGNEFESGYCDHSLVSASWRIHEKRGILIPVRDRYGRIQGLQIRRDNVEKRKFRWVSSAEKKDGCKAEGWTHLSGPVRPMLVLTEGPMKADVINALTGLTVLAVPGVNTLTQLELTLTELRSEGLVEIKTAFDMDFATNHHVQNGYNNLLQLLGDMGFRYGTYLWDPAYKGLDDYIWEYLFRKKQS